MKGFRRLLGFTLYLFMAFPLLLGGMALASVRPLAVDPAAIKSLVPDARFTTLYESPDVVAIAPRTLVIGEESLDGKAAAAAFQASVPAAIIVSTALDAIDAAFASMARGEASFTVDAIPLKGAVKAGAGAFAAAYTSRTGTAGAPAAARLERAALAAMLARAVEAEPDQWLAGEPGSRFEAPAKFGALGAGLAGASIWLLVTGAGLCLASVMVSDTGWRRRLGSLGARVLVPSVIILVIGLGPKLVIPGYVIRLPAGGTAASLPALADYLKFVAERISGGFLTAGLIGLGVGATLVSGKRVLPPPEDETPD